MTEKATSVKEVVNKFITKSKGKLEDAHIVLAISLAADKCEREGEEHLLNNIEIQNMLFQKRVGLESILEKEEIELLHNNYIEVIETCFDIMANSSKYASEYSQPTSLTQFCSELVQFPKGSIVYNPFAGIGNYALSNPGCHFFGEELAQNVYFLLTINLLAHNVANDYKLGDSFETLSTIRPFNGIIATPPFNVKGAEYNEFSFVQKAFEKMEDGGKMLMVFPQNVCYGSNAEFSLRKYLIDNRYLTHLITLPAGIMRINSVQVCVLVAEKCNHDSILIVDASSYLSKKDKKSGTEFMYKDLLSDIKMENQFCCKRFTFEEVSNDTYDLRPSRLLWEIPEVENPKYIGELVTVVSKSRVHTSDTVYKVDGLSTDWLKCSLACNIVSDRYSNNTVQTTDNMIIVGFNNGSISIGRIEKNDIGKRIALPSTYLAFKVTSPLIDIKYLCYILLGSLVAEQVQAYSKGSAIKYVSKDDFTQITIPVPSIEEQLRVIQNSEAAYIQQQDIAQVGSDLGHMLGTPFSKISFALMMLEESQTLSDEDRKNVESIKEIFDYANRLVKINGNVDIKSLERSEVCLSEFIQKYINSWMNFGSETFKVEFDADDNAKTALVMANEDALSIMFDCLFDNAHRHGFGKIYNPNNLVSVSILSILQDNKPYLKLRVGNNGIPMPKGFELKDYIARGRYISGSGRSGLGGHHVNSVIESMDGQFTSLLSVPEWTMFEFIIPQVLEGSIDRSKFIAYE